LVMTQYARYAAIAKPTRKMIIWISVMLVSFITLAIVALVKNSKARHSVDVQFSRNTRSVLGYSVGTSVQDGSNFRRGLSSGNPFQHLLFPWRQVGYSFDVTSHTIHMASFVCL
jgi:hypothetical protein